MKFLEAREAEYQRQRGARDHAAAGSWDIVEARALRWVLTERLGLVDDEGPGAA